MTSSKEKIIKKFTDELVNNQVDIPGEIRQVADNNFYDLIDDSVEERNNNDCITNITNEDKNGWPVKLVECDCIELLDRSPRYTKFEIENRLYALIDNETIFHPGEDMGSAYKLLNKFLDSLE